MYQFLGMTWKNMKNNNLILIIARASGTKEVSRQNLRLINGKPLLFYILKTSLSCTNCSTFVSTDSDEIDAYSKFLFCIILNNLKL